MNENSHRAPVRSVGNRSGTSSLPASPCTVEVGSDAALSSWMPRPAASAEVPTAASGSGERRPPPHATHVRKRPDTDPRHCYRLAMTSEVPTHDACYRAALRRDARFDGRFYLAVTSTGIYCRPVCPSPPAKREHCVFFPSAAAAQSAGFRPCRRCRPELAPGPLGGTGTRPASNAQWRSSPTAD
jgi:hypothetical protein